MEQGVRGGSPGCHPSSELLFLICELGLSFLICELGLATSTDCLPQLLSGECSQMCFSGLALLGAPPLPGPCPVLPVVMSSTSSCELRKGRDHTYLLPL